MKRWMVGGVLCAAVACTKGDPPAQPAKAEVDAKSTDSADEKERTSEGQDAVVAALPTALTCSEGAECLPADAFARSACAGRFPGMAIKMFEKSTPWKRMYVTAQRLAPVNTRGGATTGPLESGEEVLLIRRHGGDSDGMTVSGSDVDILRWDGTCATLPAEMLAEEPAGPLKNAIISWRYLDDVTKEALLGVASIRSKQSEERSVCRSSPVKKPTDPCQEAMQALNDAITRSVREGMSLPDPSLLPEWNIQE